MKLSLTSALLLCNIVLGYAGHSHGQEEEVPLHQKPFVQDSVEELQRKWSFEWGFGGISTFAHLPHTKCLTSTDTPFDIGILGVPFDTAVSYRPGARFGPRAIRAASARQTSFRGFNTRAGINPYSSWAKILDCGDIPVTPVDNAVALTQMTSAYLELAHRPPISSTLKLPKIISLGGDHSLALAALRGLNAIHGPIAVLHFDAHLDTWHPSRYPSPWPSAQSQFNHGSMFWIASNEGLVLNGSSVHAGLRTRLSGDDWADFADDERQGFLRIQADDIDDVGGPKGVIKLIMDRIGTEVPVYLSVDIDVLDPGLAPGTGTPEAGGWTSRELIRILRGIEGLNVVGADIVEVAPAYDGAGEQTALAGAQVAYEILTSIVKRGLLDMGKTAEVLGRDGNGGGGEKVVKDEL
ncbi:arginase family-domain-containing protein [Calycina marina]|uniref:Arginase family-domain-containing protein n=1 Tax=Calycina marina TaxID=1763456 RepID=A0A9P7Z813_9HELO|nr:arginase family-domain-containing protein [Calycina marina]